MKTRKGLFPNFGRTVVREVVEKYEKGMREN
jgi:hypothetical protein